jgi:superfamily II DNA or RNA helicase
VSGPLRLRFHAGTLELEGAGREEEWLPPALRWDERTACHRAPAVAYADVVRALVRRGQEWNDEARAYNELREGAPGLPAARDYQVEAVEAWERRHSRGLVVLPTGAGKTQVALMAMARKRRATLVIAPTLDLVQQWHDRIAAAFEQPVGVLGGGEHDIQPLTVSTYDSAWMHAEHLGARFGLLVFDECHHLPSESYALAARQCLAPFRLGLTATPERADGKERLLDELVGPIAYRREIHELAGEWLAPYDTQRIELELSAEERAAYDEARERYRTFVKEQGISVGSAGGWRRFLWAAGTQPGGRMALDAYRQQRNLARSASAKLDFCARLLDEEPEARVLFFTDDNATAYRIARELLLPIITHQTKVKERSFALAAFADGRWPALVTSRVLNEGIDVPEANVAVVVSGTGSVREHVQRLGRVLRPREGKRARLIELLAKDTAETYTSDRRRDHVAYR